MIKLINYLIIGVFLINLSNRLGGLFKNYLQLYNSKAFINFLLTILQFSSLDCQYKTSIYTMNVFLLVLLKLKGAFLLRFHKVNLNIDRVISIKINILISNLKK
jgi:hypothetical protein